MQTAVDVGIFEIQLIGALVIADESGHWRRRIAPGRLVVALSNGRLDVLSCINLPGARAIIGDGPVVAGRLWACVR